MQTIDRLFEEKRVDIVSSNGRQHQDLEKWGGGAGCWDICGNKSSPWQLLPHCWYQEKSLTDYIRTLAGERWRHTPRSFRRPSRYQRVSATTRCLICFIQCTSPLGCNSIWLPRQGSCVQDSSGSCSLWQNLNFKIANEEADISCKVRKRFVRNVQLGAQNIRTPCNNLNKWTIKIIKITNKNNCYGSIALQAY